MADKTTEIITSDYEIGNLIIGVAVNIGPRIMKVALKSRPDENLFGVLPEAGVETEEGFWRICGGHRLWSAPEATPRSYSPDDTPVRLECGEGHIHIYGNTEKHNSVCKAIDLKAAPDGRINVVHRIKNTGRWPVTLACWSLSVMRQGGFAVIPFKGRGKGLLPDRQFVLWPYTDFSDRRLLRQKDAFFVKQDTEIPDPFKIGATAVPSWTAYWSAGLLFLKEFVCEQGSYPDNGCNVEVYTNGEMLELETLGPLKLLSPGETAEHREMWSVRELPEMSPDSDSVSKNLPDIFL